MKRLTDIIVAAGALTLLLPLLIIVALAVRVSDGGPAFYRQRRVGKGGMTFGMLKFRSMVVNAAAIGSYETAENDPRITRLGRLLRRTSIDELPQFWNVLVGDMSLVGPRPDVPAQEGQYTPADWALRHSVRPGLTGLAQATARSIATLEERTRMDLEYVRRASIAFDVKILAMTARQLLARTGN